MAPRLTQKDQRLLRFPPTKKTWICQHIRNVLITEDGTVKVKCETLNSGNMHYCWLCGHGRPKQPKLLWPDYVKACAKAGIEPGTRWPLRDAAVTATPVRRARRKVN